MGKLLKWFKDKRVRLFQHFEANKPACTPQRMYWLIVIYIVQELVEHVETTFLVAEQCLNMLVCEQSEQFKHFFAHYYICFSTKEVKSPLMATEKAEDEQREVQDVVEWEDAITCIEDGGAFVVTEMDKLDKYPTKVFVVSTYFKFALSLGGISKLL